MVSWGTLTETCVLQVFAVAGSHLAVVCLLEMFSVPFLSDCIWRQDKLMIGKGDRVLGEVSKCVKPNSR